MLILRYKTLVFLLLIIAFAFTASAQQDHFVYLQTDNGKPFYVKMDNKILSSSPEGYIIIPNIINGVYQLKIGFPKKEYPEESFTLSINNKNEGYLIKHFEDKGLQLFDMETLALVSGTEEGGSGTKTVPNTAKEANPFTQMLANVVKDSTILQNHEVGVENPAKMTDTSKAAKEAASSVVSTLADTSAAANKVASLVTEPSDTSAKSKGTVFSSASTPTTSAVAAGGSPISKLRSKKDRNGLQMVYADDNGNVTDTVSVFIPATEESSTGGSGTINNDNFDFSANKASGSSSADTSQLSITPTIIKPEDEKTGFVLRKDTISMGHDSAGVTKTAPEQVFYIGTTNKDRSTVISDNSSSKEKKGLIGDLKITGTSDEKTGKTEKNAASQMEVLPKVVTFSRENSDCKAFADNEDFLRLRKKMASESNKEGMIKVAQKFFKSKCYSTEQIKDLSYLFLTDEGKYMFFDAAYGYTSDSDQYLILESQLKDPYYLNRFKAMIRK